MTTSGPLCTVAFAAGNQGATPHRQPAALTRAACFLRILKTLFYSLRNPPATHKNCDQA